MRAVVIGVAALVCVLALVRSRREAGEVKKRAHDARLRNSASHAAGQKAGRVSIPKMPKIKRS